MTIRCKRCRATYTDEHEHIAFTRLSARLVGWRLERFVHTKSCKMRYEDYCPLCPKEAT